MAGYQYRPGDPKLRQTIDKLATDNRVLRAIAAERADRIRQLLRVQPKLRALELSPTQALAEIKRTQAWVREHYPESDYVKEKRLELLGEEVVAYERSRRHTAARKAELEQAA